MVFLHFSSNLTEEESMLQTKYEKLKRKKKALQTLKAPVREPERLTPVKRPQTEGRDAREIAQKLIKSGAIAAIKKQNKRDETTGFKRPGGGRSNDRARPENSGHHPFFNPNSISAAANKVGVDTKLYDRLTPSTRDPDYPPTPIRAATLPRANSNSTSIPSATSNNNLTSPNTGNSNQENVRASSAGVGSSPVTLFVQGNYKINQQLLKKAFSDHGTIINISMESDKDRGFVTFKDSKCAAAALSALNGSMLAGCQLEVSYARRQPDYSNDNSPETNKNSGHQKVWASAANRKNEKGSNKEFQGRDIVSYENNPFD